ncbi:MAG TPA: biotin carboxylase N-terminal domain-containing protein [Actinomycetota bacterium]|jgi:acetyl-CoA/propionyl-CoA carboxylase biotin carboxyl carrier protein|nr:biotin carboxylase N-terminal domain-containing protein [Actinomycetota bacterium]
MFDKILVANRGEIAVRVARTCARLGVASVAVHSDVDEHALHVAVATETVRLPGRTSADTYLNMDRIIDASLQTGAQAIHPGYGFLAENADFAAAVEAAGLKWIGPPADAIRALGDKISARRIASDAGVPVVPGLLHEVDDVVAIREFASESGYPIAVKASGGGGGRGLKIVRSESEIQDALDSARREASAYFGSTAVYVERYLDSPKHLEVQLLAPTENEAMWLGVRDCSLQRRHQKLVEETPPPLWSERADEMGNAAVALSKASGYVNAGTVEMLADDDGNFFFLEVNSRLQVEHTVTEEVYGRDLVECQLRIATGEGLDFSQSDLQPTGHAIECRINAEDPARGFAPSPGVLHSYEEPFGPHLRVDSGYKKGDEVPGDYDSLIAKLIVWGENREEARLRMLEGLRAFVVGGIETTIPAHLLLLDHREFVRGDHSTATVEASAVLETLSGAAVEGALRFEGRSIRLWHPSMSASASAAVHSTAATGEVRAPMQGTILSVLVEAGGVVSAGDPLMTIEAMKMETVVVAPRTGSIVDIRAVSGGVVRAGETLAVIE